MSWRYTPYRFLFEGYPFFAALRWMAVNSMVWLLGFIIAWGTTLVWVDVIRFNEVWFGFFLGFTMLCVFNIGVHLLALDYIEQRQRERGE
ncbi:MAG: hypothetical protein EXR55_05305 [Dehalococcoidia bacterium]|nr:hypothetical protein [Dehalococcoidia bacterium]